MNIKRVSGSLEKATELKIQWTATSRMERMQKRYEGKEKKTKKGKRKTGVPGGVPLCAADTKFPKEIKKKINGWKEQRRNNGPCSVCNWSFTKFLWDIFKQGVKVWAELYYNSNIPTHNTLEFGGYRGQPLPGSSICDNPALMMLLFTLIGVIMWSFRNLSAYKLPKLALVFLTLCFTLVGVIIWHLWWAGASHSK